MGTGCAVVRRRTTVLQSACGRFFLGPDGSKAKGAKVNPSSLHI
ncbi:protein of unknown function [Cupriavidus taiwanensis]|nr:protein of unknown function [Cupriavidus taiwanensis]